MYAVVQINGHQYKVTESSKIYVDRLPQEKGTSIDIDEVLLVRSDDNIAVGTPSVAGALVKATVVEHVKADKVVVFKKKRRKGYRVKNGHRQQMTQLLIDSIKA